MEKEILEEEAKAILAEGIYDANLTEIETYHRLGKLLTEEDLNPQIPAHIIKHSKILYRFYPVETEELADLLPFGKLVSWSKLKKTF